MNLYELLKKCPVTPIENMPLPRYLMGSFRRKNISFYLCTRQISQNPYPIRILLS